MANDPKKRKKRRRRSNNLFEEPVMVFMSKVCDMILINIYWLLGCVPLLTIGASNSALYYVALKMARNDNIRSFKDFFVGFKLTFKRSSLSMLFVVPLILICYLNLAFIKGNGLGLPVGALIVFAIPILLVLMIIGIYFPLLGFYEDSIGTTIRNAVFITIRHPLIALLVLALNLIPYVMLFFYIELFLEWIIVWTFMGFGIIAYINSKLLLKIFKKELRDSDYPYVEDFTRLPS